MKNQSDGIPVVEVSGDVISRIGNVIKQNERLIMAYNSEHVLCFFFERKEEAKWVSFPLRNSLFLSMPTDTNATRTGGIIGYRDEELFKGYGKLHGAVRKAQNKKAILDKATADGILFAMEEVEYKKQHVERHTHKFDMYDLPKVVVYMYPGTMTIVEMFDKETKITSYV